MIISIKKMRAKDKKIAEILTKMYGDWMHLLNRLSVGKGYYFEFSQEENKVKIPMKVYKMIEKICNNRLDEIKKLREMKNE